MHLLLGQIELAGADVLVRVELDLLEADDAGDDVDFAVAACGRWGLGDARIGPIQLCRIAASAFRIRSSPSAIPSAKVSRIVTFVYVIASV